jgi:putative phosphoesterase
MTAQIGIISDTHIPKRWDRIPDAVPEFFRDVDLILHAGDVGELRVLDELGEIAPTIAVHGNDETDEAQQSLPYQQTLALSGVRILLCHSHIPDREQELASRKDDSWAAKLTRRSKQAQAVGAQIYVFGHLHVPMATEHDGVILLNPGAIASGNSFLQQTVQPVALLSLSSKGEIGVTHIALSTGDFKNIPEIDWSAGFRAALSNVCEYLVTTDDHITVKAAYQVAGDDWPILDEAILRCAWKRWRGCQDLITLDEIVRELKADRQAPVVVLEQLTRCLTAEAMN